MRVFLLGGTGAIGRPALSALVLAGHEVTALVRSPEKVAAATPVKRGCGSRPNWYQISPFKTSGNADALVWAVMMILSLGLILVPIIPGVRSIPRWMPIHKIVWRDYYRDHPLTNTAQPN